MQALFNQMPVGLAGSADKTDGRTGLAGAAGAANTVRVVACRAWQVKVDHCWQSGNIQTARCHVGGYHHLKALGLEICQYLGAFALAEFAMKGLSRQRPLAQLVGNDLGGKLGGNKDQHAWPMVLADEMAQQLGAPVFINRNGALNNLRRLLTGRVYRDLHCVMQQGVSQCLHGRTEGGRKKQVLPLRRQPGQQEPEFIGKTQVKQPVSFIEYQHGDVIELQGVVRSQVQQSTRCGYHHVSTAAQPDHLRVDRHTTKDHRNLDPLGQSLRQ
ncbi:hypothetical protein GALL_554420 [mine drainage metagenome]|uniref:Uncharacterized protein n=1 Tax=mine drainage metagenome TaxID=410659 RepID=A0A1J5P5D6_9ZZZZ